MISNTRVFAKRFLRIVSEQNSLTLFLTLICIIIVALVIDRLLRQQRSKVPVGSTFLGSGLLDILRHGSGTAYVMHQMKTLKSGCFRFQLFPGMDKLIIVTDPQALRAIQNDSFGGRDVTEGALRSFFAYPPSIKEAKDKSVHEARPFLLQPEFSTMVREKAQKNAFDSIEHVLGSQPEWKTIDDSLRFTQELIFRTVTPTFFADELNTDEMFSYFADFIDNMQELMSPQEKIAAFFGRSHSKAAVGREKFRTVMSAYCEKHGIEEFAPLIQHTYKTMHETEGCENVSDHVLSAIWALLPLAGAFMNTGPTFYWTLINVLSHPEAKAAVMTEIQNVLPWMFQESGNLERLAEYSLVKSLPTLDACITECLRMTSGVFVIRGVDEDATLEWTNKEKGLQGPYNLEKGETIIFPTHALHMDPEIFPNPEEFQYDRFLVKDEKNPPRHMKEGFNVRLLAFGDGKVLCPGRYLARELILTVLVKLLTQYDITVDESLPVPTVNPFEFGQGIMNPKERNYPIQIRSKSESSKHRVPLRRCSSH